MIIYRKIRNALSMYAFFVIANGCDSMVTSEYYAMYLCSSSRLARLVAGEVQVLVAKKSASRLARLVAGEVQVLVTEKVQVLVFRL